MGTAKRKPHPALIERLLQEPGSFEFFRAVQLLEEYLDSRRKRRSSRRVGFDHDSLDVGLRFRTPPSLSFPARTITAVEEEEDAGQGFSVLVSFLGLIGQASTLPTSYTELVQGRLHEKDPSPRDFLDLFHDRGTALFYRAWKKYRLAISFGDANLARGRPDPVLEAILALVGLLPLPKGEALAAGELTEAFHAGHFSNRRRSANGLRAMMRGLLGCDVQVEQFVGQWIDIDRDAWSRLGEGPGPGVPAKLGDESVLGARVWSVDARIRVVAGPLDRETFRRLWPGGEPVRYLWQCLRAYLGPLIECDLVWELAPDAPAAVQLGGEQRLGRDCWLGWSETVCPDLRVGSPPWHISDPSHAIAHKVSV